MKALSRTAGLLAGLFVFLLTTSAWADLIVGNYTLVSSKKLTRTDYEYTYRAQVTNTGAAAKNVMAQATSSSPNTTVLEGLLEFGAVAANGTATSADTFVIRHNRSYALDWGVLAWTITKTSAESVIGIDGGSVITGNGGNVFVPANALPHDETISVTSTIEEATVGNKEIIGKLELNPSGAQFTKPVVCVMPITDKLEPGALVDIYLQNEADGSLSIHSLRDEEETYGVVLDDGSHVAFITYHFSTYIAAKTGDEQFVQPHLFLSEDNQEVLLYVPKTENSKVVINGETIPFLLKGLKDDDYRQSQYEAILQEIVYQQDGSLYESFANGISVLFSKLDALQTVEAAGVEYVNLDKVIELIEWMSENATYSYEIAQFGDNGVKIIQSMEIAKLNLKGIAAKLNTLKQYQPFAEAGYTISKPLINFFVKAWFANDYYYTIALNRLIIIEEILSKAGPESNILRIFKDEAFKKAYGHIIQKTIEGSAGSHNSFLDRIYFELNYLSSDQIENWLALNIGDIVLPFAEAYAVKLLGPKVAGPYAFLAQFAINNYQTANNFHEASIQRVLRTTLDHSFFHVDNAYINQMKIGDYSFAEKSDCYFWREFTELKFSNLENYIGSIIDYYNAEDAEGIVLDAVYWAVIQHINYFTNDKLTKKTQYFQTVLQSIRNDFEQIQSSFDLGCSFSNFTVALLSPEGNAENLDPSGVSFSWNSMAHPKKLSINYCIVINNRGASLSDPADDFLTYNTCEATRPEYKIFLGTKLLVPVTGTGGNIFQYNGEYTWTVFAVDSEGVYSSNAWSNFSTIEDPQTIDNDGYSENQGDCNDNSPSIHPNATEICGDGIDQNCSGADLSCSQDTDGDGMPDWWEIQYGLIPTNSADGAYDFDGDGYTNLQELTANTDPTDEDSHPVSTITGKIPDTGQTTSYTNTFGEDADYSINPQSYTKLDANGNALPDSAATWAMVRDNVTGLIWENKTDDGSIHDKDNTYSWQNAQDVYIAQLNAQNFGGHHDWRMPTVKELSFLVHADKPYPGPTINTVFFANTMSSIYWSSTTYAYSTDCAWHVYFNVGHVYFLGNKSHNYYVRAVRAGQ